MVCGSQFRARSSGDGSGEFEPCLGAKRMGPMGLMGPMGTGSPQTLNWQLQAVNPYSGERFANILTQRLAVDATSGLLGRNFHDLTELRL